MAPTRWYMLRHPDGFDERAFAAFSIRCEMWAANLLGHARRWSDLGYADRIPPPEYEVGAATRSQDQRVVSLPLGGTPSHGALKILEDDFPSILYDRCFPPWFLLDLEYGRRDTLGWFPEARWWRVVPEEEAEKLRSTPQFQKSSG